MSERMQKTLEAYMKGFVMIIKLLNYHH